MRKYPGVKSDQHEADRKEELCAFLKNNEKIAQLAAHADLGALKENGGTGEVKFGTNSNFIGSEISIELDNLRSRAENLVSTILEEENDGGENNASTAPENPPNTSNCLLDRLSILRRKCEFLDKIPQLQSEIALLESELEIANHFEQHVARELEEEEKRKSEKNTKSGEKKHFNNINNINSSTGTTKSNFQISGRLSAGASDLEIHDLLLDTIRNDGDDKRHRIEAMNMAIDELHASIIPIKREVEMKFKKIAENSGKNNNSRFDKLLKLETALCSSSQKLSAPVNLSHEISVLSKSVQQMNERIADGVEPLMGILEQSVKTNSEAAMRSFAHLEKKITRAAILNSNNNRLLA